MRKKVKKKRKTEIEHRLPGIEHSHPKIEHKSPKIKHRIRPKIGENDEK